MTPPVIMAKVVSNPLQHRPPIPLKVVRLINNDQCAVRDLEGCHEFIMNTSVMKDLIAVGHKVTFEAGLPIEFVMNCMPQYDHRNGGIRVSRIYTCKHGECKKYFNSHEALHMHHQQSHKSSQCVH